MYDLESSSMTAETRIILTVSTGFVFQHFVLDSLFSLETSICDRSGRFEVVSSLTSSGGDLNSLIRES